MKQFNKMLLKSVFKMFFIQNVACPFVKFARLIHMGIIQ